MKLEEIFTFENLYDAHEKCRMAKQHKREVIQFEINLGLNIMKIVNDMKNQAYKVGEYRYFTIYEPKERLIEVPTYRDRVVLMCFCKNSIGPRIEKHLIFDNTACRKGKGTQFGIKRLDRFLRKEYLKENNNEIYYLKCDIRKYFPSINHNVLLSKLKKVGFSKEEIWFTQKLLKEQPSDVDSGLPLGNQASQWFALLYLDRIDRLVKEELKVKGYVRYMDDMILIHRDKEYLQLCKTKIEEVCNRELKLSLNNKTQIGKVSDGIDFLGFRHILNSNGKIIRKLRSSARIRLKRHLKNLSKLEEEVTVDSEYVMVRKKSYYAHIKDSNESRNLKDMLNL